MTGEDLRRGKELETEMKKVTDDIYSLQHCLSAENRYNKCKYKKFKLKFWGKDKYQVSAECVSFGGVLNADRELLELILNYYHQKLSELKAEFENLGKGDSE